jgi:molybdopterin molybdotransferase
LYHGSQSARVSAGGVPRRRFGENADWMAGGLISISEARELVLAAVTPLGDEDVRIQDALGRVLARDLASAGDVPPFPSSAMDGYAVIAEDGLTPRNLTGESRAGAPTRLRIGPREAIRISTGAAVPEGATAVVQQEDVDARDSTIVLRSPVTPGSHIRAAGEDMRAGTLVLSAGTRLGAVELGAAVAAGQLVLTAVRQPRVTVLCTGDELRAPGEPLGPGEIHNSNAPMLTALAARAGGLAPEAQRLPDDLEATRSGLEAALARSEVMLVTGGVSVGPHDHVKPALEALGVKEIFWGVALQPGKPTWFGTIGEKLVFGLPGNPVSAVVTFSLFALPALAAMQRERRSRKLEPEATLGAKVRRNRGREQAVRVRLERESGRPVAIPNGPQGSHILNSLLGADALAMIPLGEGDLEAGSPVRLEELAV